MVRHRRKKEHWLFDLPYTSDNAKYFPEELLPKPAYPPIEGWEFKRTRTGTPMYSCVEERGGFIGWARYFPAGLPSNPREPFGTVEVERIGVCWEDYKRSRRRRLDYFERGKQIKMADLLRELDRQLEAAVARPQGIKKKVRV